MAAERFNPLDVTVCLGYRFSPVCPRRSRLAAPVLLLVAALPPPVWGRPTPPRQVAAESIPRADPLLWRIQTRGATSYLFGTAHIGLDLDAMLGKAGRDALDGAERIFVEVDLMSVPMVEVVELTVHRAELPPGQSLRALVEPQVWERLTALHRDSWPPDVLDRLQPWFVALSTLPLVREPARTTPGRKQPPRLMLDAAISVRARKHGQKVLSLETPFDQIQAFTRAGRVEGVAMLEQVVDDPKSLRIELNGLIDAYKAHDDRALLKAFGRLRRKQPALAEHILFRRNERWVERLVLRLDDTQVFVAVGAFHMFGERGLPALLRQRGYRVERVRTSDPAAAARPQ